MTVYVVRIPMVKAKTIKNIENPKESNSILIISKRLNGTLTLRTYLGHYKQACIQKYPIPKTYKTPRCNIEMGFQVFMLVR